MKHLLLIICFWATILLFFEGCKKKCCDPKNPDCENYDPCAAKSKVLANFKTFTYIYGPNSEVYFDVTKEVDTVFLFSSLTFSSDNQSYKTYEWIIGTDPKHRFGKRIAVDFTFTSEQTIPITLIVEGSPDKNCQNKADFKDTFTKYIHFTQYSKFAINGRYKGAFTNATNNIFEIEVKLFDIANNDGWITGLPISTNSNNGRFGDTAVRIGGRINNFCFFTNGGAMNNPEGFLELNTKTKELILDLRLISTWPTQANQTQQYLRRQFKGKKIN